MNTQKLYIAACVLPFLGACCVSCYKSADDTEDLRPERSREIKFCDFSVTKMDMSENEQMKSRAEVADDKEYNHFIVVDCMDGAICSLYEYHDSENHRAMDNPVVFDMKYGTHDVYFLCGENLWESFDRANLTLTWSLEKQILKDTWAKHVSLKVSETTEPVQSSVKLDRCVSYVRFTLSDAMPEGVTKMQMQLKGGSWSYSLADRCGVLQTTVAREAKVPASYAGKTDVSTGIFTFVPKNCTSAESFDLTAYDAAGNKVGSFHADDVPIKINRLSTFVGCLE